MTDPSYRVVKKLSGPNSYSGVYLSLPRMLPEPFTPFQDNLDNVSDEANAVHAGHSEIPTDVCIRQQLPVPLGTNDADVLYNTMKYNGTSLVERKHIYRLPQLVVVKMYRHTNVLRHEVEQIEHIYLTAGNRDSMHVGSHVLHSQQDIEPSLSFAVLRPVFGHTLRQFGEACKQHSNSEIPGWFIAHIILGLIQTVDYIHGCGFIHKMINSDHIMLNLYPSHTHHSYRGYPDIQLINFSEAEFTEGQNTGRDAKQILAVVEEMIVEWSELAPFLRHELPLFDQEQVLQNPLATMLDTVRWLIKLDMHGDFLIKIVHFMLEGDATDLRDEGPFSLPPFMMRFLHSDLATADDIENALRDPTALNLPTKKEEVRRIVEDMPVAMAESSNAEIETSRIMVMEFNTKKDEFTRKINVNTWIDGLPTNIEDMSWIHGQPTGSEAELETELSIVMHSVMREIQALATELAEHRTQPYAQSFPNESIAGSEAGDAEGVAVPAFGINSAMEDMRELDPAFWDCPAAPMDNIGGLTGAEAPVRETSSEGMTEFNFHPGSMEGVQEQAQGGLFQNYLAGLEAAGGVSTESTPPVLRTCLTDSLTMNLATKLSSILTRALVTGVI
ncbi:hypothetical protein CFE70_005280 [Pyrenophora teres f. teres 0-1]